ncbi:SRPBCC family protein [Azospirillum doebereinerae]|uniref:Carbon monoxide dehydrogenase n=1 Tax=Azospirillum doebereinerae TaxID=92933 RepID=A0A3S0V393_9PROT|nr:carbon monoxide dehydrogenase subunit G [Azospirillum doebereinerae]MCG5241663.1 carbon monoxide dehydrogenase subunit G [Azospirillum doebereinerae]RUQ64030.1 carbon monoxide dehydrogenase [Azospirillum doebereinerae]
MDMSGSHRIEAPRDRVWAALNDPEVLRQCIPGCEEVVKLSDTEMTAKVVAKVGPVSAKFAGKVTLSDLDPPNGYTISGEGSGGAAGFGKGGATVALADDDGATLLTYTARAQVGGKLAQIGSRLVDATARKMADDFFSRFTQAVGAPPSVEGPENVPPPAAVAAPAHKASVYAAPVDAAPIPIAPVVTPQAVAPPPEVPLPSALRAATGAGESNFYLPWGALLLIAVLGILLAWMT